MRHSLPGRTQPFSNLGPGYKVRIYGNDLTSEILNSPQKAVGSLQAASGVLKNRHVRNPGKPRHKGAQILHQRVLNLF